MAHHQNIGPSLSSLRSSPPSFTLSKAWRLKASSRLSLWQTLDRAQVLGDVNGSGYGHKGCVNAVNWSQDGATLISSGDDCRLCVWRQRSEFTSSEPPVEESIDTFSTSLVLRTGHSGNVFSAKFLPHTSDLRIATCSADSEVRVFDLAKSTGRRNAGGERMRSGTHSWEERPESDCCVKTFNCHKRRVKRIVTEDSPDRFLTVSEDHTVRQHDLRTPHRCSSNGCPSPLLRLPYALSAIACSPVAPYYFVVAGESAFGHLFDRRMIGRIIKEEWGQDLADENELASSATRCVRRFGRAKRGPKESKDSHVTGAKMANSNGCDLVLSYSADAVHLYNIRDDPLEVVPKEQTFMRPNTRSRAAPTTEHGEGPTQPPEDVASEETESDGLPPPLVSRSPTEVSETGSPRLSGSAVWEGLLRDGNDMDEDEDDEDNEDEDDVELSEDGYVRDVWEAAGTAGYDQLITPIVLPRRRFAGTCNVETVKDVNLLGARDEYVSSGSDDGHFFLWRKADASLVGIWEGDGGVVNVVEDRPASHSYPMLAVSGLDCTVKLFAPRPSPRSFCHTSRANEITSSNAERSPGTRLSRVHLAMLYSQLQRRGGAGTEEGECRFM